jgi:hypothetical protein
MPRQLGSRRCVDVQTGAVPNKLLHLLYQTSLHNYDGASTERDKSRKWSAALFTVSKPPQRRTAETSSPLLHRALSSIIRTSSGSGEN